MKQKRKQSRSDLVAGFEKARAAYYNGPDFETLRAAYFRGAAAKEALLNGADSETVRALLTERVVLKRADRIRALRSLWMFQFAIPTTSEDKRTQSQFEGLLIQASREGNFRFFEEYAEALRDTEDVDLELLSWVFVAANKLIFYGGNNSRVLPTKREIRRTAQQMLARHNLVLEDEDGSFRKLSAEKQKGVIAARCENDAQSERTWTRIFRAANLTDFPEDPGGQPTHAGRY